jgi:pimeloyl-ACP methyl ester carboxylesterase
MRSESDWLAFLAGLEEDRKLRVVAGTGRRVHPREEIMVPSAERKTTTVKSDVDGRIPTDVPLACAEEILSYQPLVAASGLTTPLLVIGVEGDATTPTDHAEALYAAASGPKELIVQRHTTHYAAYDQYWEQTTPRIVEWFDVHVQPVDLVVRSTRS